MATAKQIADKHHRSVLESIEASLEEIDKHLRKYDALIQERQKLQSARRALLNERAPASGGGRGLSQAEVVQFLKDNGGSTVNRIASGLSVSEAVVRGHLNRGKDERFRVEDENGVKVWFLREPEEDEDDEEDDEE